MTASPCGLAALSLIMAATVAEATCCLVATRKRRRAYWYGLSPKPRAATSLASLNAAACAGLEYKYLRCPVRLSDSTLEFPIIKTTKLL